MRRVVRLLGTLLIVAGLAMLGWAVLVWKWQDPVTAAVEWREQHELEDAYDEWVSEFALPPAQLEELAKSTPAERKADVGKAANRFRRELGQGEPVGTLTIGRLGLKKVVVNGTDTESLKRGPGRDPRAAMPGQGKLVYIAGHRTTYGAPFSHIDDLRPGDYVKLDVPYGTFTYRVTGHAIVPATDIDRLRDRGREELALQACHPRFFATERYIVYARFVGMEPRGSEGDGGRIAAGQASLR